MNKYFTLFKHSNFKTRMDSLVNREFKGIEDVNKEQAFGRIGRKTRYHNSKSFHYKDREGKGYSVNYFRSNL
jgi:hypothetical protein